MGPDSWWPSRGWTSGGCPEGPRCVPLWPTGRGHDLPLPRTALWPPPCPPPHTSVWLQGRKDGAIGDDEEREGGKEAAAIRMSGPIAMSSTFFLSEKREAVDLISLGNEFHKWGATAKKALSFIPTKRICDEGGIKSRASLEDRVEVGHRGRYVRTTEELELSIDASKSCGQHDCMGKKIGVMAVSQKQPTLAFSQGVIEPPGSGKTTHSLGMQEFLSAIARKIAVVNLDPANNGTPYPCAVDISELITLADVMENLNLGPLIYCMEYLEANLDWLQEKLAQFKGHYFLFDCPGQVELCTHHSSLRNFFAQFAKCNLRMAAVHLVDSHYCTDPGKFISVLCTSLTTMLYVELPHVNVLSKMDLIKQYGKLAFNLDYYTEVLDLSYLIDHLASDPFFKKYRRLNEKLVGVIEDYSLVSFVPLNVQDKESMRRVMQAVDKANS
ncbi:GPN-loop GTPase 2-like [Anolis sagrei]|uniref:GPN-loop GTPase 2-like n=1 Tax=Anolis sagrei TaxID=38937 RepID=UPI0035222439